MPMHAYMMHVLDPQNYVEEVALSEREETMDEQYNFLIKNLTRDLVMLPSNHKLVRCKWVY